MASWTQVSIYSVNPVHGLSGNDASEIGLVVLPFRTGIQCRTYDFDYKYRRVGNGNILVKYSQNVTAHSLINPLITFYDTYGKKWLGRDFWWCTRQRHLKVKSLLNGELHLTVVRSTAKGHETVSREICAFFNFTKYNFNCFFFLGELPYTLASSHHLSVADMARRPRYRGSAGRAHHHVWEENEGSGGRRDAAPRVQAPRCHRRTHQWIYSLCYNLWRVSGQFMLFETLKSILTKGREWTVRVR